MIHPLFFRDLRRFTSPQVILYTYVSLIHDAVSLIHGSIFDSPLSPLPLGDGQGEGLPFLGLRHPPDALGEGIGGRFGSPWPPKEAVLIELFEVLVSSTTGRGIAATLCRKNTSE
jgi:hypothetical protein